MSAPQSHDTPDLAESLAKSPAKSLAGSQDAGSQDHCLDLDRGPRVTRRPGASDRIEPGARVRAPRDRPRVVVLDDDELLRSLIADVLAADHDVVSLSSADAALHSWGTENSDLVICDLALPGRAGEEFIEWLRRETDRGPGHVPILVIVSGRAEVEGRVRLLRAGADDYVSKPFSSDELRARANKLISNAQLLVAAERRAGELQHALDSRVVIEQAKGIVAATRQVPLAEAFELLRGYCRARGLNIHRTAEAIVAGTLGPHDLDPRHSSGP